MCSLIKFFQKRRLKRSLRNVIRVGPPEGPGGYEKEIKPENLDGSMHTLAHFLNQQRIKANEQENQQSVEDNDP